MSVERYITEIPLTFDVGDDLVIHRKIKYETYAANPADAETTARMFVTDFAKTRRKHQQLCQSSVL